MNNNFLQRSDTLLKSVPLLHFSVVSGFLLLVLIGGALIGLYATGRFISVEEENRFYRLLVQYDYKYRRIQEAGLHTALRQELDGLDQELTRLEKQTEGVESWLSILKRRRKMAELGYKQAYVQSSKRAALAFPHSTPIAAVASAALVHEAAITREAEAELRAMLPLFVDSRFASIRLSLHVLLGDFTDPQRAFSNLSEDLSLDFAGQERSPAILADMAILKVLAGDTQDATGLIQTAIDIFSLPELIRLAAEFSYDFGDMLRSAELFSMLTDDSALSRQADALWLAGYADNARHIWSIQMADSPIPQNTLQSRALYNLALTAQTREEAAALFERLAAHGTDDTSRRFGLILYSRLLNAAQAIALLDAERDLSDRGPADPLDALIGLEILKRRAETGEVARIVAETWMLLERFPQVEDLYQWGAWYFDLQRSYAENTLLLKTAARHDFTGQWAAIHTALAHIREGNMDAAEDVLASITETNGNASWIATANLGRVLETRHAPAQALVSYEKSLAAIMECTPPMEGWHDIASRIQVRRGLCLKTMGRLDDSRRAFEYALNLNPDNLIARLEFSRL